MDKRFAIRGGHTPKDVVVVAVDEKSLGELGPWPFPRRYHAQLIKRIADDRSRAIAVDIQFSEPSDQADDSALAGAVRQANLDALTAHDGRTGQVVLGTTEVSRNGGAAVMPLGGRAGFMGLRPSRHGVLRTLTWGSATTWPDGEAAIPLESFALVAAELATGRRIWRSRIGNATPIAYVGRPGTVPTYSYADVLHDRVPRGAFTNKVVVVGATASSLGDVHSTPYGADRPMGGAEIEANAIETALHDFPLRPSRSRALLLIALFSFLVPIASLFLRWRWCVLIAALAGTLYLVAAQISFDHGILLPAVWPLLALVLSTLAAAFLRPRRRVPAYSSS
jgi:CHASE2 domain-containing sensor protein